MQEPTIFSTHIQHRQWDFVGTCRQLAYPLHHFNSSFNHNHGKGYSGCIITGLSLRGAGQRFSPATMNVAPCYFQRKIEEK